MKKLVLAAAVAVLFSSSAAAEDGCHLYRLLTLDMEVERSGIVVPAAIGEHPLRMMVDTGAYITIFSEETATDLGLSTRSTGGGIAIYGGIALRRSVSLSDFRLGRMKAPELTYPLAPQGFLPRDINGLLGADFLIRYDLDFDFANGKFSLFSPDHCDGKVGWWAMPEMLKSVPFTLAGRDHIAVSVTIDGKEVEALIDTGASVTTMNLEEAEHLFGLKREDLADAPSVNGIRGDKKTTFKKMSFGDVEVLNPNIILVPDQATALHHLVLGHHGPKMIIGRNILQQLHLYIAYREKKLYLTPASAHR